MAAKKKGKSKKAPPLSRKSGAGSKPRISSVVKRIEEFDSVSLASSNPITELRQGFDFVTRLSEATCEGTVIKNPKGVVVNLSLEGLNAEEAAGVVDFLVNGAKEQEAS